MQLDPGKLKKTIQFLNDKGEIVYMQSDLNKTQMSEQYEIKGR